MKNATHIFGAVIVLTLSLVHSWDTSGKRLSDNVKKKQKLKHRLSCSRQKDANKRTGVCFKGKTIIDNIYVLNLPHRADRWNSLVKNFKKYGITPTKIPREAMVRRAPQHLIDEAQESSKDKHLSNSSSGIWISHMWVWKEMLKKNMSYVWVFEDDARLLKSFLKLPSLLKELERVDPKWDFVYSSRLTYGETKIWLVDESKSYPAWAQHIKISGKRFWAEPDRAVSPNIMVPGASEGVWGYIISNKGARKLLELNSYCFAGCVAMDIDMWLSSYMVRPHVRMYAFHPQITDINRNETFSDNQNKMKPRLLWEIANKKLSAALEASQIKEIEIAQKFANEAQSYYNQFIQAAPADSGDIAWAYSKLGIVKHVLYEDLDAVEAMFKKGIEEINENTPDLEHLYFNLARNKRLRRQNAEACNIMLHALKINPSSEDIWVNLHDILKDSDGVDAISDSVQKLIKSIKARKDVTNADVVNIENNLDCSSLVTPRFNPTLKKEKVEL